MHHLPLFFCLLLLMSWSCADTVLDTDLLDADEATITSTDNFEIRAKTIVEDSILVYAPNIVFSQYPFGQLNDPILGKTTSSIYAQLRLGPSLIYPNFPENGFDSIVLSLAYSEAASYGDIEGENFDIKVYRMTEDLDRDSTYTSDRSFTTEATPIASTSFVPNTTDSISINIYENGFDKDSLYKRTPQVRIPLSDAFGEELYSIDSLTSEVLLEQFKGLHIVPASENNGILGFDLGRSDSRLTLYYHNDSTLMEYNLYFTEFSAKTMHLEHDYTGTPVENAINDATIGDSLVYIQGMAGPLMQLDFPNIAEELDNALVNTATLELFVATADNPSENFVPIQQLMVSEPGDSTRIIIEDGVSAITNSFLLFDGALSSDNGLMKYTINISAHAQEMVNGIVEPTLFIQAYPKASDFARTIFYGAKHSTYPMRLKITYTELPD